MVMQALIANTWVTYLRATIIIQMIPEYIHLWTRTAIDALRRNSHNPDMVHGPRQEMANNTPSRQYTKSVSRHYFKHITRTSFGNHRHHRVHVFRFVGHPA